MFPPFSVGTLFLIRTPEVFPPGYADQSFADMKALGLDYAAWLETWNCADGVVWISDRYPRSSFWKDEPRDPLEETLAAADRHGLAFLPEAGVMHSAFREAHQDAYIAGYDGVPVQPYGRIGLVPACPLTLDYFVDKYETLMARFGDHPSLRGLTLPCENGIALTYDHHTRAAYRAAFGEDMPAPEAVAKSKTTREQVFSFLEDRFLELYRRLAGHLKAKYGLPLMHYPLSLFGPTSHDQPQHVQTGRNLSLMTRVEEVDMWNMQIHPPLNDNIYFFKAEAEAIQALCGDKPCVADTHFYHEGAAGRLPPATPKRFGDWVTSTITPHGISFFCYGFFAPELPGWKKELNPGAEVFKVYTEPGTVAARRERVADALAMVAGIKPWLADTRHDAPAAIWFREEHIAEHPAASFLTEHVFGFYEAFQAAALPVVFTSAIPVDASRIKLLLLHAVRRFDGQDAAALRNYLAAGGAVLISGACCAELWRALELTPAPTAAEFVVHPDSPFFNQCWFAPPLDSPRFTLPGGETILPWNDGTPAVAEHARGAGRVVFWGAGGVFSDFSNHRRYYLAWTLRDLATRLLGAPPVELDFVHCHQRQRHQWISADMYRKKDGAATTLLLRNFGVETRPGVFAWRLEDGLTPTAMQVDGRAVDFAAEYRDGAHHAALPAFEHLIAVHAERARPRA